MESLKAVIFSKRIVVLNATFAPLGGSVRIHLGQDHSWAVVIKYIEYFPPVPLSESTKEARKVVA